MGDVQQGDIQNSAGNQAANYLTLGYISGVHGVRGWVKVFSYTKPLENILLYSLWQIKKNDLWQPTKVLASRKQGSKLLVAQLAGVNDRDQAHAYMRAEIAILKEQLPEAEAGEYYWADLVGLAVKTVDGVLLGQVENILETGANDVLVVQGDTERLIPFVQGDVIKDIDLDQQLIIVDWPLEY